MEKALSIILIVAALLSLTGYTQNAPESIPVPSNQLDYQVLVYDRDDSVLYDKQLSTEHEILIDALKEQIDLDVVTVDSQYGEYIVSIKGIEQGDNYYWNYYVNGEYAQVGVSSQKINNNDIYTFRLEKFE